jgi:hypothetical protein
VHPGDTVLFITASARPAYPLISQMGLVPTSRWLYMVPLQLLVALKAQNNEQLSVFDTQTVQREQQKEFCKMVSQRLFSSIDDDVSIGKPEFIIMPNDVVKAIVDEHEISRTIAHDYDFAMFLTWKKYKEFGDRSQTRLELLGNTDLFTVYKRRNSSGEQQK